MDGLQDAHEQIISAELFAATQERLERKRSSTADHEAAAVSTC
jgi:hypothetical protein